MTKLIITVFSFILAYVPHVSQAQDGYAGSWQLGMQNSISPIKQKISDFHDILLVIITLITVFVLALILWISFRYRRAKNPNPATFAHNTFIEVVWTLIPIIILIGIAIPSFNLLYLEDRTPEPEMTLKVTGYQWYWGYEYPDYDGLTFLANMKPEDEIDESLGDKRLLTTDAPVVVPVDTNIQLLVTAADVLHAFALPAAGVKRDAVPGRTNEAWMRITRPGTYYGQCSEICGTGHAYMPIEIKAVSKQEFAVWIEEAKEQYASNSARPDLTQAAAQ